MSHNAKHTTTLLICALALLTCISCLERKEEITVARDGTVTIQTEWSGKIEDFDDPISRPSEPEWTVLKNRIDSSFGSEPKLTYDARKVIPYGEPLPSSFASKGSPNADFALQFPSEIRFWKDGDRTYYEFKRTYQARLFSAFNISEMDILWNRKLEEQVLDKGLLNVSESDRNDYLKQFGLAFGYQQWRFMWEALAAQVHSGDLDTRTLTEIHVETRALLENIASIETAKAVFLDDTREPEDVLDSLGGHVQDQFREAIIKHTGNNSDQVLRQYDTSVKKVRTNYNVTERLSGQEFTLFLKMPGIIIETNGLLDIEEPDEIMWWFKGDELHDKDIPVYALSVVEH